MTSAGRGAAPSRRRETWQVVMPAMRLSWARARDGGATRGDKVTLSAIHQLLALYQRLEDRVSLGQIAREEGLWRGAAADCPKSIRNAIGQRLKRLHELGAIVYEPARFAGDRARIGLPRGEELGREAIRGDCQSEQREAIRGDCQSEQEGKPDEAERQIEWTKEANRMDLRGIAGRLPSEGFPRDEVPREEPEYARARTRSANRNHVGSLAARLTACATTDVPDIDYDAERVSELILDHLPADAVHQALDEILELGDLPTPTTILTPLADFIDEQHADELAQLAADPRRRALIHGGTVLAIADACPGPWVEHLEEAELVDNYAARHGIHDDLLRAALDDAVRDGLRRPGHVAKHLRTAAGRLGLDLPPLTLPPARRITRNDR